MLVTLPSRAILSTTLDKRILFSTCNLIRILSVSKIGKTESEMTPAKAPGTKAVAKYVVPYS